jgi:2-polyprenyl-3-methyl-5-hydroxy-6-metoxy-1,4-benzoquinol methylase
MTKPSTPEFDQYAGCFEEGMRQCIPAMFAEGQYFAEYKIRHIARRLAGQEVTRFLDFGCGIGQSLCLASAEFPNAEIWGYDLSTQCIELARQRAAMAKLTNDLDDLPSGGFDVIFAANVFHHIPRSDRLTAMGRCKSLLRASGRIFLFEHNPVNPVTRRIFERCPFDKGAAMLRQREAIALAEASGLSVVRSDYTLFFPRQLSFLRPLERMLAWLPLGAQYCVEITP